ncbi:MAG TPA: DUF4097 family beta strand repeat-containing protein [Gemmatimonadaceae bacterium]|jgi:DUF4097 and DUF4098 domain-containing protein YvlB
MINFCPRSTFGSSLHSALFVLALSATVAGAQRRRDYDRDYRSNVDTSFDFDRRGLVSLTLGSGDIIVTAWSRDQIRIHATSESGGVRLDASSSRVSLELSNRYGQGGDSRFEVTVPVGVRIVARAQSGDIAISGTQGEVDARSQSGDIKIGDVASRLDIGTLSGDIEARGVNGDIQIKSVSGDIRVTDFKGDFEGETVSGSIELHNGTAHDVRSHTTSGDLVYDGTIDPSGRYELSAHSGDIRLNIPSNTSAQLSVSTWSGTLDSDFPITLRPGEHGIGSGQAKRFTFDIGNGAARISAETFSGDITIGSRGSARREQ